MISEVQKLKTALAATRAINKEKDIIIDQLQKEVERLRSKLYTGEDCDTLEAWKFSAEKQLVYYIETLASAFYEETNLPPHSVVLKTNITEDGKGIKYWFEEKKIEMEVESHET